MPRRPAISFIPLWCRLESLSRHVSSSDNSVIRSTDHHYSCDVTIVIVGLYHQRALAMLFIHEHTERERERERETCKRTLDRQTMADRGRGGRRTYFTVTLCAYMPCRKACCMAHVWLHTPVQYKLTDIDFGITSKFTLWREMPRNLPAIYFYLLKNSTDI